MNHNLLTDKTVLITAAAGTGAIQASIPQIKKRFVTYGLTSQADFQAADIVHTGEKTSFEVHHNNEKLGSITLHMPGRHNVLNALAAVAVSMELELPFATIAEGLDGFGGVQRRFQVKYNCNDILVVDDYGHHPVEIKATLSAACSGWDRRVVAVFQPHRYSRTQALFEDFLTAFYQADKLVVMDVYAASEDPIPGVEAKDLCDGIAEHGHKDVTYLADKESVVAHLSEVVQPGDMVITLGAGNVWQVGEELIKALQKA